MGEKRKAHSGQIKAKVALAAIQYKGQVILSDRGPDYKQYLPDR
jgi:hypothetical protein